MNSLPLSRDFAHIGYELNEEVCSFPHFPVPHTMDTGGLCGTEVLAQTSVTTG